MNKKIVIILLTAIIILAAVLRLWGLGAVPASPDWDEAALGYNAYSLLQTGRDEYGKFMPIVFQSFNDYKPAVYSYFIIPLLPFFGLTTFAVRLPSAILGILTVLATFFLMKELFGNYETKNKSHKESDVIALLTTFLLAISPWHIQFSRVAFEANAGLAFSVLSILFFLKGLRKPWLLLLSATCMALNLSIYQSERVFMPLIAIALACIYWKQLIVLPKKYLIGTVVIGLLFTSPLLLYISTNPSALSRAKGVSVLSQPTPSSEAIAKRYLADKTSGNSFGALFHNRRIAQAKDVISGYVAHYDPNWLFITGDDSRHHAPSMGLLYLWELPFLLIGIYSLFFFPFPRRTKLFLFAWFLLAPIPASVTFDVPHAVRTLNFLPTFQLFIALGLVTATAWMSKQKILRLSLKYPFLFLVIVLALFNFCYYVNQYFVQLNYFSSKDWQYGYKEAVAELTKIEPGYKKIVISNVSPMDQSYIFILFYEKYPPQEYQKQKEKINENSGGFAQMHAFDRYEFRPIDWDKEVKNGKILYVGLPSNFPGDIRTVKTIYYLDGKPAIEFVER